MKLTPIEPPRTFEVGRGEAIQINHCANLQLEPNEQVTFTTDSGVEYDVVRKLWGFYATPSLNGRLQSFGLHAVLVKSPIGKFYIFLVESGKESGFNHYLKVEGHSIVAWLDNDDNLAALERKVTG